MAVNTFTFGGVTSSTYGIYVSGEALFNAPKRDAEIIQIPGRDGDFVLDKGSFENIEVTYRVFNQEKDLTDFRTKLSNLRSALCSKTGYQRLTDTFHPDEYRMAAFIDGIEINPVKYNTASEFEIKFNCKPQRFLTSGETAVSVASGGKVTNPTLFDAKPQLQVWGSGDIDLSGNVINVNNVPIGQTLVYGGGTNFNFDIDLSALETGDNFTVSGIKITRSFRGNQGINATVSAVTNCTYNVVASGQNLIFEIMPTDATFTKGTAAMHTSSITYTINNGGTSTTVTETNYIEYKSNLSRIHCTGTSSAIVPNTEKSNSIIVPQIFGESTKLILGSPLYIDLDIGEAYKIENNSAVSVNNGVQLPAELPTLPPGDTTITYDNTITQFKVLPRWWKV